MSESHENSIRARPHVPAATRPETAPPLQPAQGLRPGNGSGLRADDRPDAHLDPGGAHAPPVTVAHYDPVTGLPNRGLLCDRLTHAIARAKRGNRMIALIHVNINHFRLINENLDYAAGDAVLREIAQRLQAVLREVDTVARIHADRFAVIIEGPIHKAQAARVAEKILKSLSAPLLLNGREIFISASIGISLFPPDAATCDALLKTAEIAAHEVKTGHGEGYAFYAGHDSAVLADRFDLESRLHHALERNELKVWYQPKVDIATGRITGAEALIRWHHPELGMISPARFVPLAEETGLIVSIGQWVLDTACRQLRRWRDAGLHLNMAVNLSPRQFRDKRLLGIVADAINDSGIEAELLELEITETMTLDNPEHAAALLKSLRGLGVRIALDDFGTGHSSLSHLRRFKVDTVKIDRSFVIDIATSPQDRTIVTGVTSLGHALGLHITAEGVENKAQLDTLRQCGCDDYQGYHFSAPVSATEFDELLHPTPADPRQAVSRTMGIAMPRRQAAPQGKSQVIVLNDENKNCGAPGPHHCPALPTDGTRPESADSNAHPLAFLSNKRLPEKRIKNMMRPATETPRQRVILIVEDQDIMRNTLRDFLQSSFPEWTVIEAINGDEAMDMATRHQPDLILMDVCLPDANGINLTRSIKALLPETFVIVVSSLGGAIYVDEALTAGAQAFVPKSEIAVRLPPLIRRIKASEDGDNRHEPSPPPG